MVKSICIKTNNKNIINYLLNEFEYFDIEDTYISVCKFKYYNNIIIHYKGKNKNIFFKNLSTVLTYTIIDFYEPILIRKLIL